MERSYPGMDKRLSKSEALDGKEFVEEALTKATPIFTLYPRFVQTPQTLAFDPAIKLQLKAIYGILHGNGGEKRLNHYPLTFKSQKRMAKEQAGISRKYFNQLVARLKEAGWVTIISRGLNRTAIIVLHAHKGQKVSEAQKKMFKRKVDDFIKSFMKFQAGS